MLKSGEAKRKCTNRRRPLDEVYMISMETDREGKSGGCDLKFEVVSPKSEGKPFQVVCRFLNDVFARLEFYPVMAVNGKGIKRGLRKRAGECLGRVQGHGSR